MTILKGLVVLLTSYTSNGTGLSSGTTRPFRRQTEPFIQVWEVSVQMKGGERRVRIKVQLAKRKVAKSSPRSRNLSKGTHETFETFTIN